MAPAYSIPDDQLNVTAYKYLACSRLRVIRDKQKKRAIERIKDGRTIARNGKELPSLPLRSLPSLFLSLAAFSLIPNQR